MSNVSDKLRGVRLKIERAKKHVSDLQPVIDAFRKSNPYKIDAQHDPQTRRLIYRIVSMEPVPDDIPIIVGDAVQCLRSALDHLAYQLWLIGSLAGNGRRVQFPIFSAQKQKTDFPAEIQGMGQPVVDAFDALQPYKGGKGNQFWVLSELNNADKHRLLVSAVGRNHSVDVGGLLSSRMAKSFPERNTPIISMFLEVAGPHTPLKPGEEIFSDVPAAEPNEHLKFAIAVSLHEPGIVECEPILPFIHQLTQLVENTVPVFASFL